MKTVMIVDRRRLDEQLPAIVTIASDGSSQYSDEAVIRDKQGIEVARMTGVAAGKDPVGSARVWIETELQVQPI
jgi:hypothetical protein